MAMSDEVKAGYKSKAKRYKPKKTFKESFIPQRGDKPSEIISKLIVFLSVAALLVCAVVLSVYFYHLFEARQNHANIKVIYKKASDSATGDENSLPDSLIEPGAERKPLVLLPAALTMQELNLNYAGFVEIPNCVSEAVVQYEDNDFYLDHNIYDQKRSCGTVFADFRNIVNDYENSDNIILYGHNQKDGTMFGQLDYYKFNPKYWLTNPYIYFDTLYSEDVYVIIASFITNTEPEHDNGYVFDYHNFINFKDEGDYTYDRFMTEITERSQIITGIDVNSGDKFLTLSTCSYEWEPSRHVLVARKLREGETTQNIDTSGFNVNTNPKWPAIYYKYNGGSYSG